jgi:hypothetical protein
MNFIIFLERNYDTNLRSTKYTYESIRIYLKWFLEASI